MASGVAVDDDCKDAYQEIKLGHKHRYIVFRLSPNLKSIIVEKRAPLESTYDMFLKDMQAAESVQECRYAIYDVQYKGNQGIDKTKLCFFMWSPETAKIKQKMVYAASKDALKRSLGDGIAKEVQATDNSELDHDAIIDMCIKSEKN